MVEIVKVERVWLNSADVMRYLNISHDVLDRLRREAKIRYYKPFGDKIVFYKKSEIDEIIQKGRVI
ncbi:helix-turn-helix domain-containing protein [Hallella faecis]|uniref:helix-turn-helix domain-containing protein n=1 Tax=Hallella faecis TaxID=2841596 RepID=UPI003F91DC29